MALAENLAQKVYRELPLRRLNPPYLAEDLFVLLRQACATTDLFFYMHADERRDSDVYWRKKYTFAMAPLVRTVIDNLYTVTRLLQYPGTQGEIFRAYGFKQAYKALERDEARYRDKSEWKNPLQERRASLESAEKRFAIDRQKANKWNTLGTYSKQPRPGGTRTDHQKFIETFTYGSWSEYSELSHGGFEGLLRVAPFFMSDTGGMEMPTALETHYPKVMTYHVMKVATLLLCILTELQVYFRFDDPQIDMMLGYLWESMSGAYETKELYDGRYRKLMADSGLATGLLLPKEG